jgi:hypothetical protein
MRPDTNCRWNAKKAAGGIIIEVNAPGARALLPIVNAS